MRIIRRHKRIAIFAVLAVFVMAGVAGAYWTQGGSGTGSAATATTASITVNQTSPVNGLFPSASAALSGNFTNPNTSPIFVHSVTAVINPAFDVPGTGGKPDCTPADFTITGTANVNAEIPAGPGTGGSWSGLTITMVNRTDTVPGDGSGNQDACKNVTVPIVYTAS